MTKANSVHKNNNGFQYDYSKFIYINSTTKGIIICSTHGEFRQKPSHHLNGHGCPKCTSSVSKIEQKWLTFIGVNSKYHHKTIFINKQRYFVDAYDPNTNTVYEFYGDYWHGNLNKYNPDRIHPHRKLTFKQIREESNRREEEIKNAGYNLVTMWESDFKRLLKRK